MTSSQAYWEFEAKFPKSMQWLDFDCAPRSIGLDGDFTLDELKEIIRLAEAMAV